MAPLAQGIVIASAAKQSIREGRLLRWEKSALLAMMGRLGMSAAKPAFLPPFYFITSGSSVFVIWLAIFRYVRAG
jgi:hypothetical protein